MTIEEIVEIVSNLLASCWQLQKIGARSFLLTRSAYNGVYPFPFQGASAVQLMRGGWRWPVESGWHSRRRPAAQVAKVLAPKASALWGWSGAQALRAPSAEVTNGLASGGPRNKP